MNLHSLLRRREADGKPLRVGLIGAGKFGSMYLSHVRRTPGVRLTAVADLDPSRARAALVQVGWRDAEIAAVAFTDEAQSLIARRGRKARRRRWPSSAKVSASTPAATTSSRPSTCRACTRT